MTGGNKFFYRGIEYTYVYLKSGNPLSEESNERLMAKIIEMDTFMRESDSLKGDDFEAKVVRGKMACLGTFYGTQYNISLETDRGRKDLSLLFHQPRSSRDPLN